MKEETAPWRRAALIAALGLAIPAAAARVELVPETTLPVSPVVGPASAVIAPVLATPFAPTVLAAPVSPTALSAAAVSAAPAAALVAPAAAPAAAAAELPAPLAPAAAPTASAAAALAAPAAATEHGGESAAASGSVRFDGSALTGAAPAAAVPAGGTAEDLVDAYQDGRAVARGASPRTQEVLSRAADRAVRDKLAQAHFKVFYLYGGILGTKMYEAPELPGVILKAYASPFGWKGDAWKGYNLAKQRLGGLFAETTIIENVEVTIEGKKRRLRWAMVQEKVKVEGISEFGRRSTAVLLGMLKRGVRDNDRRPGGVDPLDIYRNLGEVPDGRFVHFDADRFGAEEGAVEGPKRVRDPPVLREAIRAYQLDALKAEEVQAAARARQDALDAEPGDAKLFGADQAVAGLAAGARNWYFETIRRDPRAVAELRRRIDALSGDLKRSLPEAVAAALSGHETRGVAVKAVYAHGSQVWGKKGNDSRDTDVLVVANGEVKGADGTWTRDIFAYRPGVKTSDGRDFDLLVISPGLLRRALAGEIKESFGMPLVQWQLFRGDGVLLGGRDELAGDGGPSALLGDVGRMLWNAGKKMELFVFGSEQVGLSSGRTRKVEGTEKIPAKLLSWLLEANLVMDRLEPLYGIASKSLPGIGRARDFWPRYFDSSDPQALFSEPLDRVVIALDQATSRRFDTLRAAMRKRPR